ncbi:hypothetical protein ACFQE1_01795 [Halobium palmae]|uniref:Uncharacterized protein n=1 Tax=Halobium palmae TaxID=1776492 RepID=A0ABD5RUT8_9EURY
MRALTTETERNHLRKARADRDSRYYNVRSDLKARLDQLPDDVDVLKDHADLLNDESVDALRDLLATIDESEESSDPRKQTP